MIKRHLSRHSFQDILRFKIGQLKYSESLYCTPELSLNKIEFITQNTKSQGCILEFGSGGSTLEFQRRGFFLTSVETDRLFARRLNKIAYKRFGVNPVTFCSIGLTGSYGYPLSGLKLRKHKLSKFIEYTKFGTAEGGYDTVIIDGRFRVASFLSHLIFSPKPPRLICIDDYKDRVEYLELSKIIEFDGEIDGLFYYFVKNEMNSKDAMELYSRYIKDPR
jgi:hypothetical protein